MARGRLRFARHAGRRLEPRAFASRKWRLRLAFRPRSMARCVRRVAVFHS